MHTRHGYNFPMTPNGTLPTALPARTAAATASIALFAGLFLAGCGPAAPNDATPTPTESATAEASASAEAEAEAKASAEADAKAEREAEEAEAKAREAEAAEAAKAEESKEEEPDVLANQVSNAILTSNGVDSFQGLPTSSPLFYVSEIEDVSSGTIRVYLQDALTDDEQAEVAKHVANMSCLEVDGLKTIVTQDTTGADSNHQLMWMDGILPACQ